MERMAELIALGQRGERKAARSGLEELWAASTGADPVTRCAIAHSLADVQDHPEDELAWDLKALMATLGATDDDVAGVGINHGTAGLMPSLHLNLADVYRRLGQTEVARGHALQTQHALRGVDANPYFDTIAEAADRVLTKLEQGITD